MGNIVNFDHAPMVVIDLYNQLEPIQIIEEAQALAILMQRRMNIKKARQLLKQLYCEGVFCQYLHNGKKYVHLYNFRIDPYEIDVRRYLMAALWVKLLYAPNCFTPMIMDGEYPSRAYFFFKNLIYGIILPEKNETNITLLLDEMAKGNEDFAKFRAYIVVVRDAEMLNKIRIPQTPGLRCDFALYEEREGRTPQITIYRRDHAGEEKNAH